jgi:hypothetical protein
MITVLGLLLLLPGVIAQEAEPEAEPATGATARMDAAVVKGLTWLSDNQSKSGSWGESAPVATTAIAGLAFLAHGSTPGRGDFGETVQDTLDYLLQSVWKSGYINEGAQRGAGGSGMHGHGYATLFLAEVYGMTRGINAERDEELRSVIQKAVDVIEASQSARGGWYYEPARKPGANTADEGSVTVTQVQALRSARNAGFTVQEDCIEKALEYIYKSANPDGTIRYSLTSGSNHTSFALTAAGMSVLNFLGEYNSELVTKGLDYCMRYKPGAGINTGGWYFHGHFYAAIAFFQAGGERWDTWFPAIREELLDIQNADGAWSGSESQRYGNAFGTAHALIVLQLPYRYLPIMQD